MSSFYLRGCATVLFAYCISCTLYHIGILYAKNVLRQIWAVLNIYRCTVTLQSTHSKHCGLFIEILVFVKECNTKFCTDYIRPNDVRSTRTIS